MSRGNVELKRGAGNYWLVSVGEPLYSGDLLRVRRGSTAEIQCSADKTTWTVPDNGIALGSGECLPIPRKLNKQTRQSFIWPVRQVIGELL